MSQTTVGKEERAMHHLQCRDFYFDFMSFLSPYSIVKKSVCILRQTVVENDDGGGHLHFLAADKAIGQQQSQRKKNLSSSLRYFCNDIEHHYRSCT